ncbi:MAG: NAD(P)-dependent oxidoreductase [Selenomonadaceae bacterium]|nr:NAD(P)-dependent oxidoreductase [Selenomonadaceae bacterium]
MSVHVINEAKRCLQCKKPMCRLKGCPIETNIPEMIRLFLEGKGLEAAAMLFANNPMSMFCSLVCDHEKQCEGHCVQGIKGSAIHISSIEHYISDAFFEKLVLEKEAPKGKKVAIVGSGPAGMVVAVVLAQKGYDVTIFERKDKIGGMMRYGIPEFRLPRTLLERYGKKLRELGIHIRPNTTIGGALHLDDLFGDGYKAIFIGSGTWRARRLGVPGESLGNVHYTIDYLQSPEAYELGDTVAVIGAGNSAMDAARTALRRGARFVSIYARGLKSSASEREVEYTLADGVDIFYGMGVKEITDKGPVFVKREYDENGNLVSEGEPELHEADSTIIAVSQRPKDKLVNTTHGLDSNDRGLLEVDEKGQTSREGIFSAGDVVTGPLNVVKAARAAKETAENMAAYLETL